MLVDCSKTILLLNYKENLSFMVDIYGIWIGPHRSLSHRRSLCRWSKTTLIVWQQRQGARIAGCQDDATVQRLQYDSIMKRCCYEAMVWWQWCDDNIAMIWWQWSDALSRHHECFIVHHHTLDTHVTHFMQVCSWQE